MAETHGIVMQGFLLKRNRDYRKQNLIVSLWQRSSAYDTPEELTKTSRKANVRPETDLPRPHLLSSGTSTRVMTSWVSITGAGSS
jgi:hypothetical protein